MGLAAILLTTTQHLLVAADQSPAFAPASLPLAASSGSHSTDSSNSTASNSTDSSSNSTASLQGFIKVEGLEFVDGCGDRFIPVGWNRWALAGLH